MPYERDNNLTQGQRFEETDTRTQSDLPSNGRDEYLEMSSSERVSTRNALNEEYVETIDSLKLSMRDILRGGIVADGSEGLKIEPAEVGYSNVSVSMEDGGILVLKIHDASGDIRSVDHYCEGHFEPLDLAKTETLEKVSGAYEAVVSFVDSNSEADFSSTTTNDTRVLDRIENSRDGDETNPSLDESTSGRDRSSASNTPLEDRDTNEINKNREENNSSTNTDSGRVRNRTRENVELPQGADTEDNGRGSRPEEDSDLTSPNSAPNYTSMKWHDKLLVLAEKAMKQIPDEGRELLESLLQKENLLIISAVGVSASVFPLVGGLLTAAATATSITGFGYMAKGFADGLDANNESDMDAAAEKVAEGLTNVVSIGATGKVGQLVGRLSSALPGFVSGIPINALTGSAVVAEIKDEFQNEKQLEKLWNGIKDWWREQSKVELQDQ